MAKKKPSRSSYKRTSPKKKGTARRYYLGGYQV